VIAHGTTPEQRVVQGPLRDLPQLVEAAGLRAPSVIVIGPVARFRDALSWYEQRPLFGRRVLVARSVEQRGGLVIELRRRAALPILTPLLEFAPPFDPSALERALADPDAWDWIAFTSANAVRFASRAASAPPARARVACVGAATAAAARRAGWPVHVVPPDDSRPEALARAMRTVAELSGVRVLFPRASAARETLVDALERMGAQVTALEAYRTILPSGAQTALRDSVDAGLDALALTSPTTVERVFDLLDGARARRLADAACFACIGPTTRAALEGRAVRWIVEAADQSDEGLADAIEHAFAPQAPAVN
jgi:uroporphyrinogen III methyltransferase/synthase